MKLWNVETRHTYHDASPCSPVQCLDCGRWWDDGRITSMTPAPAARCPFEGMRRLAGFHA